MNTGMRTNFYSAVSFFLLALLISCRSDRSELQKARQEALQDIEAITARASFHHDALLKTTSLIKEADHNIELIVQIAEYISQVPYETLTLYRIAEIAARAEKMCPELREMVELTIMGVGRSDEIVHLAERYSEVRDATERKAIEKRIRQLQSYAKYSSVEDALQEIHERK